MSAPLPELYVVMSNLSGKQNLGTYLRTASAFGATQVIVVGSQRFGTHGAHRAQKYINIVHVYKFEDARVYLKEKNCTIYGIQQMGEAPLAAHTVPYAGNAAFVLDNEFPGLSVEQRVICDSTIHVPFHGPQRAPLQLDATVVTAIVLHHFTRFAKFPVRAFESTSTQGKFVLDAYPTFDPMDSRAQNIAAEREAKRAVDYDDATDGAFANIF